MTPATPPAPKFPLIHLRLNLLILSAIFGFFITLPAHPFVSLSKPAVKAAFTRTPPIPRSRSLPLPRITASAVFIIDLSSQSTLFAKQPNTRLRPASLTKIMTALVALDYYNPSSLLSVNSGSLSRGAKAELVKGDLITAKDALYALLVPSGNDAAVTLAENYPGGYQKFVAQMNAKAVSAGLANTHFANVSGVDSPLHYTSAFDIAMLAKLALDRPLLKSIFATRKITLKSDKGHIYPLVSTNLLLEKPGVLGVKTGWTPEAGECLVTFVERNGHPILISLLGSKNRFDETEKLINWVYSNFSWE